MNILRKVLVLILFLPAACSPPVKNTGSKGQNIICFGDSITYGVGAQMGKTYPFYLSELIGKNVVNAGVPGDTTSTALRRLGTDVLSRNPYLVIVELGGNDFLHKVPLEITLDNIDRIISAIQREGAMVALCDMSDGFFMSEYSDEYRELARERGAIFIPLLMKGIFNNSSLKSDYIHPNSSGYRIIARRVFNKVKSYIKGRISAKGDIMPGRYPMRH